MHDPPKSFLLRYLTPISLLALALGVGAGVLAADGHIPALIVDWLKVAMALWIAALKLVAIPLMLGYVAAALFVGADRTTGKLGVVALGAHIGFMLIALAIVLTAAPLAFGHLEVGSLAIDQFADSSSEKDPSQSASDAVMAFATANPVIRVIDRNIFTLIIIVGVFSGVLGRNARMRDRLLPMVTAATGLARRAVNGLVMVMPLVVFVLAMTFVAESGFSFAGVVLTYLVVAAAILSVVILILMLSLRFVAGFGFREIISSLVPVILMACTTRSSLACMPVVSETARESFGVGERAVDIVVPLSVAAFKLNKIVTTPTKMMVLAVAFGIAVAPGEMAFFLFMAGLTSFGTPGVPAGSGFKMLPLYVALGIPVEGYLLTEVIESGLDLFKTSVNAVEDTTLPVLADRWVQT